MPTHSGQIAFVGGHRGENEEDPWIVAQREFNEETGLSQEMVHFLGYLPPVMTARLQPIVPVLAELLIPTENFLSQVSSNGEWDNCLAYPWSELQKEENWDFGWRNGHVRSPVLFHGLRPGLYRSIIDNQQTYLLWGATAAMVWDFLRLYYGSGKS